MADEIKTVIDELGSTVKEFRDTVDQRIAKLEKNGSVPGDLTEKLERINDAVDRLESRKDAAELEADIKAVNARFDDLEEKLQFPGGAISAKEKAQGEHLKLFDRWIRSCRDDKSYDQEAAAELKAFEKKQVDTATGAAGGFGVPEVIGARISELQKLMSPFRNLVRVFPVGTPDYVELTDIGGEAAVWVGETDTRNETGTPELRERRPTFGELMALPKASEHSLDDIFFNVSEWLARKTARQFAITEGDAIISGNGTNKPTGFLNTTPVTTADDASPLRAAAAVQYVPVGAGSPVSAFDPDGIINLQYELHENYAANAVWAMNRRSLREIRKLKDSTNQYLWSPGLQAGEPASLLGDPVAVMGTMANPVADAYCIAYGDWQEFYMLCDRVGLRITLDQITAPGFVRWYIRKRVGGCINVSDAVKVGKFSLT